MQHPNETVRPIYVERALAKWKGENRIPISSASRGRPDYTFLCLGFFKYLRTEVNLAAPMLN